VAIGHGFALVGDEVIAVTRPGGPRMPNGIEAHVRLSVHDDVRIGCGVLESDGWAISAGPVWQPRPRVRYLPAVNPRPQLNLERLPGLGPGLTPLGDDILIGYLAGLALTGGDTRATMRAAHEFGLRTTALSRALLRLAARGELPEPAHALLEHDNAQPIATFGATSGKGIALGLGLACGTGVGPDTGDATSGLMLKLSFPSGGLAPGTIRTRLSCRAVPSRSASKGLGRQANGACGSTHPEATP
jgi:uncharacterized protein DUF2877